MKKSFTLIELLVVIAIIGSLAAILLPNYMAARENARDVQRKSDLSQIQKAIELYKQDQSPVSIPATYPPTDASLGGCWSSEAGCSGNIYMNKLPTDPVSGQTYGYSSSVPNLTYTIEACLDNIADKSGVTCQVIPGFSCTSPKKCYIVTQP